MLSPSGSLRICLLLLLLLLALGGCAPNPPGSALVLDTAELFLGAERPGASAVGERVELPDRWFLERRRRATHGWYRMAFERPPGEGPLAVLALQARLNAEFFVNGRPVGRIGSFGPPVARNPGHPFVYALPDSLLSAGRNTLEVHLATTEGFPGRFDPVWVGPADDLAAAHDRLRLLRTLPARLANFAAVLLAALLLAQAATRRHDRAVNALLGAAAACIAVVGATAWTYEIPLPSRLWEWLVGAASQWAALLLVLAAHRYLKLARPRLERSLLFGYTAATAILGWVPHLWLVGVWVVWGVVSAGLYVYLLFMLVRGARSGRVHPSVPIVTFFAVLPFVGRAGVGFLGAALALLWFVVARNFQQLRETEDLNRELEARVAEREEQVQRSYERLRELERARAVAVERERITRDMHDGTGGHLTSALALARSGEGDRDALVGILQEALDDLRLTIESLDPGARDLPSVVGMLRGTLERRLSSNGVRLVWRVGEAGAERPLASDRAMHVMRIVQESVTNAIKHAQASEVTIRTGESDAGDLLVEVRDDGCGAEELAGGRGIDNMRERAAGLGGRVELHSGAEGTVVRLHLPPPPPDDPAQSSERTIPS